MCLFNNILKEYMGNSSLTSLSPYRQPGGPDFYILGAKYLHQLVKERFLLWKHDSKFHIRNLWSHLDDKTD